MALVLNGSGITSANIADGTITNADINASAGIVGSKLDSDLSTGTLTTTGGSGGVALDVRNGGDLRLYAANNTDNVVLYCDHDKRLNLNGTIVGGITQVIQDTKTDTSSTTGTSWVTLPGLSVQITPRTTASRIIVQYQIWFGQTSQHHKTAGRLRRTVGGTATSLLYGDGDGNRLQCTWGTQDSGSIHGATYCASGVYVDSPSTTSAITYDFIWSGEGGTAYINRGNEADGNSTLTQRLASSIVVMEVGG